jgi:hypothetical protein
MADEQDSVSKVGIKEDPPYVPAKSFRQNTAIENEELLLRKLMKTLRQNLHREARRN